MHHLAFAALFILLVANPVRAAVVIDFDNATPGSLLTADF